MARNTDASEVQEVTLEEAKTYVQGDIDMLKAIIAQRAEEIAEKDAEILKLINENSSKDEQISLLESSVESLNDKLNEAEKPSFEAVQLKLKPLGLVAVIHRGEVRKSTIGSLNGVHLDKLSDDELDELEDMDIITDLDE